MTAKFSASADGTKVTIGTAAEDALQIDATAKTIKALAPYNIVNTQSLVSFNNTQREGGTPYTNTTGQTIMVMATLTASAAGASIIATLTGGIILRGSAANAIGTSSFVSFPVPPGGTYRLDMNSGTSLQNSWVELR